jgi:hypothetical protein
MRYLRLLPIVFFAALVIGLVACSSSSADEEEQDVVPTVPAEEPGGGGGGASPPFVAPPIVLASADGSSIEMGIGTYCWGGQGQPGLCVDKIGFITKTTPLTVASGGTIVVEHPGTGDFSSVAVTAITATGQPQDIGNGELAWMPSEGTELASTLDASGLSIAVALDPGSYVLNAFAVTAQGDVSYGLLIEVN